MKTSINILVDADAFIAMVKDDDTNHQKAARLFNQLEGNNISFITTNYVFSEAITVISQRTSHQTAINFIDNMKSPESIFLIIQITQEIQEIALEIFKKQTSKNVSFVDCTNMALIKHDNLDAIFSFDEIYKRNGFKLANSL